MAEFDDKSSSEAPCPADPDTPIVKMDLDLAIERGEMLDLVNICFREGYGNWAKLWGDLQPIYAGRHSTDTVNFVLQPLFIEIVRTVQDELEAEGHIRAGTGHMKASRYDLRAARASRKHEAWAVPQRLTAEELDNARPTPDCIVEDYLYADVGLMPAPGGFGKTTLVMYEAACIAGGADTLWGRKILKHGPVVVLTGEDSRELLAARLKRIMSDNGMMHRRSQILDNVLISDVSGSGFKLTALEDGVVVASDRIDDMVVALKAIAPVLIIVDPAISFGVGEAMVNDAEQGLIVAGRRLRNELTTCVRYLHHTGKQNAREKRDDQYAGRGGSAFADGARMVHVLGQLSGAEWIQATGEELLSGETGLKLTFAKSSYTPPQNAVYIRRQGFNFTFVEVAVMDTLSRRAQESERIMDFLHSEMRADRLYTKNTLEKQSVILGFRSRSALRQALQDLLLTEQITISARNKQGKGGAAHYLHPREPLSEAMATTSLFGAKS